MFVSWMCYTVVLLKSWGVEPKIYAEDPEPIRKKLVFFEYYGKVTDDFCRALKKIDALCQPFLTLGKLKPVLPSDILSPIYPVKILSEIRKPFPGFHRVATFEDAHDFLTSLLSKPGCVKIHGTFESSLKLKGKKQVSLGHRYITDDEA